MTQVWPVLTQITNNVEQESAVIGMCPSENSFRSQSIKEI